LSLYYYCSYLLFQLFLIGRISCVSCTHACRTCDASHACTERYVWLCSSLNCFSSFIYFYLRIDRWKCVGNSRNRFFMLLWRQPPLAWRIWRSNVAQVFSRFCIIKLITSFSLLPIKTFSISMNACLCCKNIIKIVCIKLLFFYT